MAQHHPIFLVLVLCHIMGCASTESTPGGADGVLEPVDPSASATPSPSVSPWLPKLMERLTVVGYEGVGLTYESDGTLEMLFKVFSDPLTANRQIRFVYTGLANAYDAKAQSLTVGGTSNVTAILTFIQKKVPRASASGAKQP